MSILSDLLLILYCLAIFFSIWCIQKMITKYKRKIVLREKMIEDRNKLIDLQDKRIEHLKFQLNLLQDIKIIINGKGTIVDKFDMIKELVDKSS